MTMILPSDAPRSSKLSRREQEVLELFRQGYTAQCRNYLYIATLTPPAGTPGKKQRVRELTLAQLTRLGYLTTAPVRTFLRNKSTISGTSWTYAGDTALATDNAETLQVQ